MLQIGMNQENKVSDGEIALNTIQLFTEKALEDEIMNALKSEQISLEEVYEFLNGKGSSDRFKTAEVMLQYISTSKLLDMQDYVRKLPRK